MKAGWQTKRLGDIANIELGRTPARSNGSLWDPKRESKNVWLSIADLLNAEDGVVQDSKEYVSDKGAALCRLVQKGTLLVSFKLTLGRLAFAGRDLYTNEAIAALTLLNGCCISKEFLFWFLQYFDWVKAAESDVKLKGMTLNKGKLQELRIHFPGALEEQQRIVAILDAAFAEIATAKANAEKNLQNAQALFESYLNKVFTERGEEWVDSGQTLDSFCELIVDCEHKTAPTQDDGFPSIRTPNIGRGRLLLEGVNRVSDVTYKEWTRRAVPQAGDLIFAREAPAGNVAVIPEGLYPCLGQRTVLIRPLQRYLYPQFLAMLLLSPEMQNHLLSHSRGATVQHINMKDIRALKLGPIPALDVQKSSVSRLEEFLSDRERLESIYQQKLTALEELKKSLLHQAFSGNL